MQIQDMTINEFELIKDNLQKDFDEFWNNNILKEELLNQNTKYIFAKDNDKIIGFAGILITIDSAEIMNIVVRKDERKKGIGKRLLQELISIAKNEKVDNIFLEVNFSNVPAKKLYDNIGFRIIGIRKKYYNNKDDAIIMKLSLK